MRILKISLCCFVLAAINLSTVAAEFGFFNNPRDGIEGPSRGFFAPPAPPPRTSGGFRFERDVLPDIIRTIPKIFETPRPQYPRNTPQPRYVQPRYIPQPNYTPPQYTPQPQYTPPVVVSPVPPAPVAPKNEIVTTKKKPVQSAAKNNVSFQLGPTQAETDARQEIEALNLKKTVDAVVLEELRLLPDGNDKNEAIKDYQKLFYDDGSTQADFEKYLKEHGPGGNDILSKSLVGHIGMQSEIAGYKEGLQSGLWSPSQKDAALNNLQNSLDNYGVGRPPKFVANLQQNLTNMHNYNTLGKLALVAQHSDNPFAIMLQGTNTMQMPPMFLCELTGYPVMTVDPVADQLLGNDTAAARRATIILDNPASNGQTVKYMLDKFSYTMEAGHNQQLDRNYVITFDPGNGLKQKSYTLGEGYFVWSSDPKTGWDLHKKTVKVEIDNSRYSGQFSYLLNGERQQVAPGEIAEHSSDLPLEITFHAGRDGTEHRKVLKPGSYLVGLDPSKGTLDLFSANSVEEAEEKELPYQASTTIGGSNATQAQRVQALLGQLKSVNETSFSQLDTPKGVSPIGRPKVSVANVDDLLKSIKPPVKALGQ